MSFIQQMSSGYDSPLEIKGQALIINAILLLDSVRRTEFHLDRQNLKANQILTLEGPYKHSG